MDKCEVFLSNGKSILVTCSIEQLLNKVTDKDGELLENLVLIEEESGASCYLNPNQIVTVSVSQSESEQDTNNSKEESEGEHTEENLDAIQNLSKDIGNME